MLTSIGLPKLHPLQVPSGKGAVVSRSGYKAEAAYKLLPLGLPQYKLFELFRRYNKKNNSARQSVVVPSSPLEEYRLSLNGHGHDAFKNVFASPGTAAVSRMLLRRKPGPGEYRAKQKGQIEWRRDVYVFDGQRLVKVAESQPIPAEGVVTAWDPALGLPLKTTGRNEHTRGTKTHWVFNSAAPEVAVVCYKYWDAPGTCFDVYAVAAPRDTYSFFGARPVRLTYKNKKTGHG